MLRNPAELSAVSALTEIVAEHGEGRLERRLRRQCRGRIRLVPRVGLARDTLDEILVTRSRTDDDLPWSWGSEAECPQVDEHAIALLKRRFHGRAEDDPGDHQPTGDTPQGAPHTDEHEAELAQESA
jgi:hypothetical protein